MKTEVINYNKNLQIPVQGGFKAPNAINKTAPTQISFAQSEDKTSSAASKPIERNLVKYLEALKAQTFAQAPVSYAFIREINLPFSNNAKLYKLSNGQKVVVLEKKGPTVLQTYYNVGSMNEPDEVRGISHFNEHMAFNGSRGPQGKTLGSGDFFKIVNELGAMTNASTGFSQTDYFISSQLLGDNVFDKSAFLQSQQLLYPEHTAEMVEKEKGPVTSEISMVGDNPDNIAINNCIRNLYNIQSSSPDLIAGTIKNINNLTREKTLDYYNLWYTPDNCHTIITGEVPAEEAVKTIAKYYNKTPDVDISKRKYQDFVGITSPVRIDTKMPKAQSSTMVLGFSGPQNKSAKENIMLEVLISSLLGSKTARLSKELDKIQSFASANIERVGNRPTDPKTIMFISQMTPDKTEDVIRTTYRVIEDIAKNPLQPDELETVKKSLKMAFSKISENSDMLNVLLGNALLDNDLEYIENYLPILDSITPQEISDFAKKYLDLNKASLSVVHPQNISEEKLMANYQKANFMPASNMTQTKKTTPSFGARIEEKTPDVSKIKQYKLANNMEIAINPNNTDISSGIISMKTKVPLNVNPCVPGLLRVMLNEGSRTKNYLEFYKNITKSGASLRFEADFQSISASFDSLSEDTNMLLDAIQEVFNDPRFTPASFEYAKNIIRESAMNMRDSAEGYAFHELFPNNPDHVTRQEYLNYIDKATLGDVVAFFNYIKNNAMAKGTFTTPVDRKPEIEQNLINKLSSGLGYFQPYEIKPYENYQPITQEKVIKHSEPRNQANIVQAFKFKTNYNPKDHVIFRVLNTILGDGPSSRLFNDLREKQKLAYRVESNLDFFGNTGVISLGIRTTTDDKIAGVQQFDNVQKSLDGFKKHIELLKTNLVPEEELNSAKMRIKTKLLNSIETSDSQTLVFSNAKESLNGMNSFNEGLKTIDEITAEDIRNAANYIFSTPSVISVLASEDTINNMK